MKQKSTFQLDSAANTALAFGLAVVRQDKSRSSKKQWGVFFPNKSPQFYFTQEVAEYHQAKFNH